MASIQTGADLQQFVCSMQWISAGIPKFSSVIRALADHIESVYAIVGKRTRLASDCISRLAAGWKSKHEDAFCRCKEALENQVTLSHVDRSKRLCV